MLKRMTVYVLILAACSGDAQIPQALLNSGADATKTLTSAQTA